MKKSWQFVAAVLMAGLISAPGFSMTKETKKDVKIEKKLTEAEAVLKASVAAPDQGIPRDLLEKAECVGVFPGVKKAAFIVGGEGGKGVFTCRNSNGMSGPVVFKIGGPSIGWQAGIQEADLVLLIMNKEGVDKLLSDKFKIGAEASAAAGPVGRNAEAATDAMLHAQILSWSRARGAFAGISLEGIVVAQDKDDNAALYNMPVDAREVLVTGGVPVPDVARSFVRTTELYTKRVG